MYAQVSGSTFYKVRYQHSKQMWWVNMQTFVANFLSYNNTKYCYNLSTLDSVITKIKRMTFFETQCIYTATHTSFENSSCKIYKGLTKNLYNLHPSDMIKWKALCIMYIIFRLTAFYCIVYILIEILICVCCMLFDCMFVTALSLGSINDNSSRNKTVNRRYVYTTPCPGKRCHFIFHYDSRTSWSIFVSFSLVETGMNTPQSHVIYFLVD